MICTRLSGVSLLPLLEDPTHDWENIAFHQFIRPLAALRNRQATHMGYSVRTDEWRCTYWYDMVNGKIVERELYNLAGDNIEMKNLAGKPGYDSIEFELANLIELYRAGKYMKR